MKRKAVVMAGISVLATTSHLSAQVNTDALAQLQALINAHGSVPYTHAVPHQVSQTYCHGVANAAHAAFEVCESKQVTVTSMQTDQIVPTAENIRIVKAADIAFDPSSPPPFPINNC